jgi:hypothetical protein
MSNDQFSVFYNGHPVAVTNLGNDSYLVQVTYKPLQIQLKKNNEDRESWVETESQLETYVSKEIGNLISNHLYSVPQA